MHFFSILFLILPIFLPIFFGYVLVRIKVFSVNGVGVLTKFFFYVAMPSLIISLFAREKITNLFDWKFTIGMVVLALFLYGFVYIIERYFFKLTKDNSAFAGLASSYVNAGIIGLPVLLVILPQGIAAATVILNGIVGLLILIPLTILLNGSQNKLPLRLRQAVTNPVVGSTLAGLLLSVTQIPLPRWLENGFTDLSQSTFAVALFAVGMSMAATNITKGLGQILFIVWVRMILSPLLALLVAVFLGMKGEFAVAFVLIMSLATAKSAFVLAEEYKEYDKQTAEIVTITTLTSIIVIPIVLWVTTFYWPGVIR